MVIFIVNYGHGKTDNTNLVEQMVKKGRFHSFYRHLQ